MSTSSGDEDALPSLGVAISIFDSQELLQPCLAHVRSLALHVCVVYQTESNVGNPCNPHLVPLLEELRDDGLIDELVEYVPGDTSKDTLHAMITTNPNAEGVPAADEIGTQYLHETMKRELGRQACLAAGCAYLLQPDCDEFYRQEELELALRMMHRDNYDVCAARMRYYFKKPQWELLPRDESNWVPVLLRLQEDRLAYRLMEPFPVLVDPTRRVQGVSDILLLDDDQLMMHHMSFVRLDMLSKLLNVSNQGNYTTRSQDDLLAYLAYFQTYSLPSDGSVSLPHAHWDRQFQRVEDVGHDEFDIKLASCCHNCMRRVQKLAQCARCKTVQYCGGKCQREAWPMHKLVCRSVGEK